MIFMMIMPVWYFVLGIVLILIPMMLGFYILHKRQGEVLQIGLEQNQQLNSISEQTSLIPNIDRQFMTPQHLAQFTITLSDARSTVLYLGDILYVTVEKKRLQFHLKNRICSMDGKLCDMVEGDNPFLPFPLFVQVQKSYIINVLAVIESRKNMVYLSKLNEKKIPVKIPLSDNFFEKFNKAFLRRENKGY